MLKVMIQTHWMRVRLLVGLVSALALTVPINMVLQGGGAQAEGAELGYWLVQAEAIGRVLPVASVLLGLFLGLAAWSDDAKGRHVYALTLPLARERYVLYRFVAGALPALAPAGALLAGGVIATTLVTLPDGIHAYPVALAGRTLLASLTMYAVFFALASATRNAAILLLGGVGGIISAEILLSLLGFDLELITSIAQVLMRWPAPFAILTGRWALFDV